mgnify:CR=1 FL=1
MWYNFNKGVVSTMKLDDIRKCVEKDISIDDTQLDIESLKTPQLHNKYLNMLHDERFELKKMKFDHAKLIRLKWEYYTGKMPEETLRELDWEPFQLKVLKQDMDKYLESDDDLILIQHKLTYQQEKVSYLESIVKTISQRNWEIRNAIEWRKFINGV